MGLESHSKHGILIGCISIIISLFVCMQSLLEMNTMYSYRELVGYSNQSLFMPIATLIISLLMIIFSALMICGIIKKRPAFMTPWLIAVVIGICCEIIYVGFFNNGFVRIQIGVILLTIMAFKVLMLYPIYILYNDIRYNNDGKTTKDFSNNPAKECTPQMDVV